MALVLPALWKAVTYIVCDLLRGDDTFPTLEWLLSHRGIKASLKKPEGPGQVLGGVANPAQTLALPSVLCQQAGEFLVFFFS